MVNQKNINSRFTDIGNYLMLSNWRYFVVEYKSVYIYIYTYTLPAKNMEYFLFQRFCAYLWSVEGVSVPEIHSYGQILPLGELIST